MSCASSSIELGVKPGFFGFGWSSLVEWQNYLKCRVHFGHSSRRLKEKASGEETWYAAAMLQMVLLLLGAFIHNYVSVTATSILV